MERPSVFVSSRANNFGIREAMRHVTQHVPHYPCTQRYTGATTVTVVSC
jgi:hypothetical protein